MIIFEQSDCVRSKWFYYGKSGCIRLKLVAFWQKLLYFGKVVVFRQSCCNRKKVLYSSKVVVSEARVVVFGQSVCIRQK